MPHNIEYFRAELHEKLSQMEISTTFTLTDIFGDWEGIEEGKRRYYVALVREAVQKGEMPGIEYIGIAKNRSNEYQVVKM